MQIPEFVFGDLRVVTRPDCGPTSGGVKLSTTNGALKKVSITIAPLTFLQSLPFDASMQISGEGSFYMGGLPIGTYTFTATDACRFNHTKTVDISGYNTNSEGFTINRKCGSFDISIADTDPSISGKTFWLQKFFPSKNSWGKPYTEVPFIEGSIPSSSNAKEIGNNTTLRNIFLIEDFRILKVFDSFTDGNPNAKCADLYVEFTVAPELIISGAYSLSCNNGEPNNVVIDVVGVAPFTYKLTAPFTRDNGQNNLFTNLPNGTYNFKVRDSCGNIRNIPIQTGRLLPLARATKPDSMLVCRNDGVSSGTFSLVNQTPQILGSQNPESHQVTYHLNQTDADLGVNSLPDGYTNITNPQTIYARVKHKTISLCYATTSFVIFAGATPILKPSDSLFLCEGATQELIAEAGFSTYA